MGATRPSVGALSERKWATNVHGSSAFISVETFTKIVEHDEAQKDMPEEQKLFPPPPPVDPVHMECFHAHDPKILTEIEPGTGPVYIDMDPPDPNLPKNPKAHPHAGLADNI